MNWLALFITTIVISITTSEITEENNVLVLKNDNFDEAITKNEYILIKFYAPWCGHCKALAPEWEAAAEKLKSENSDIRLGKVDVTEEKDLGTRFNVSGFPTIKYFRQQQPIDFQGERKADDIVSWCKRKQGPSAPLLSTSDELVTFRNSSDIVIVGFIKNEMVDFQKAFNNLADTMEKLAFAVISDPKLFAENGITKDAQVVMFKKFDEGRANYDGELQVEELMKFIVEHGAPLLININDMESYTAYKSLNKLYLIFASMSKHYNQTAEAIRPLIMEFRGKANFLMVDTDDYRHERIFSMFGYTKMHLPTYGIAETGEKLVRYRATDKKFSLTSLRSFIQEYQAGNLKPYLLSDKIPADSNEPVRVLVGKNYNDVVKDNAKTVFVMLYFASCPKSEAVMPIWEELAKQYAKNESVIIAKMDIFFNEVDELKYKDSPTFKLYPKDIFREIDYTGEQTLEAFKTFVENEGDEPEEEDDDDDEDEDAQEKAGTGANPEDKKSEL